MKKTLAQQIAITWELCGGREITDMAMNSMKEALEDFDPSAVERALIRCQTECRGHISLADIIQRIDDGRPGPEEAWAMMPKSEDESAVWTAEMSEAYGIISGMMGDRTAARMAFKEAYQRICGEARAARRPIEWLWSPGFDKNLRAPVLLDAVEKGRLTAMNAMSLAPELVCLDLEARGLLEEKEIPRLEEHQKEKNDEQVPPEQINGYIKIMSKLMDIKEKDQVGRKIIIKKGAK